MERLVGDENLRATSLRVWKDLPVKILRQAKLESAHVSRLNSAIRDHDLNENGNLNIPVGKHFALSHNFFLQMAS